MPLDLATIDKKYLSARTGKDGRGLLTPIARMYYPTFFTPRASKKAKADAKKKYGVQLFVPNVCDLGLIKQEAQEAAQAEWGSKAKDMSLKNPFLKAENYKYEGLLPGWTMLRLTSTRKPEVLDVVNGSLVKLTEDDPEVVYSGRWCTCDVTVKAYSEGSNGVTIYLNHVLLLNHDENLSGRMKAEDLFEAPDGDLGAAGSTGNTTIDSLF